MTATQITITNQTIEDVVTAVAVAGKCKVISCPNPGDAASPVTLHMGDYSRSIGQSADYRHDISESVAEVHEAGAIVQGWWDNDSQSWYITVDLVRPINEARVREIIAQKNTRRDAAEAAKRKAANDAEHRAVMARGAAHKAAVIERARQLAEERAPGRVAVWEGQGGRLFAGRWDAPYIPGSGTPSETWEVIVRNGQVELR